MKLFQESNLGITQKLLKSNKNLGVAPHSIQVLHLHIKLGQCLLGDGKSSLWESLRTINLCVKSAPSD